MIIAVSDIHLGDERSEYNSFKSFINSELKSLGKNDHFILLGDILEFCGKKELGFDCRKPNNFKRTF